jgi:hypothetical protein
MAGGGREQRIGVFVCGVVLLFLTAFLARNSIEALLRPPTQHSLGAVTVAEINDSAFLAVIAWCLASPFAVWGPLTRCRTQADRVRYGRLLYTWACALTLLHIAVAFHTGHGWSHERAYEHVEAASGFGPGLYVNYAFVLVWMLDVLWAWVALETYLNRPHWVAWSLLVFMAFIVFNAAVVFGTSTRRLVSAGLFVVPLYAIWAARPRAGQSLTCSPNAKTDVAGSPEQ